jgi:hypothetical protein
MSSETWKKEVTVQRGEYSARLKQVRHINEKESLSWPTATVADIRDGQYLRKRTKQWMAKGKVKGINLTHATENEECRELYKKRADKNWPTPTSTEISGTNPKTGKGEGLSKKVKNWATPNTMDYMEQRSEEALRKQATTTRKGRTNPSNLREQVNPKAVEIYKEKSWPTPEVHTVEKYSLQKDGQKKTQRSKNLVAMAIKGELGLSDQEKSSTSGKSQGRLNPNWVEQLMGLPLGWTQLPIEWTD